MSETPPDTLLSGKEKESNGGSHNDDYRKERSRSRDRGRDKDKDKEREKKRR